MNTAKRILKPVASLKLTVILFALSMVLILAGTLAQTENGIWTVVDEYFRSLVVRIPLRLFAPQSMITIPGAIFFPGGLTLGVLLLVNLLSAHIVRFKLNLKRMGIILMHAGVILLLVGEFVTGGFAEEGNMSILEGQSSNFVEDIRTAELAIVDTSGPDDDLVVVVPESFLRSPEEPLSHNLLPFDIHIDQWMPNSQILGPMQSTPEQRSGANAGLGLELAAVPVPVATGVTGGTVDLPSAYITLLTPDGPIGSYLVSIFFQETQQVVFAGKPYTLQLRFKRTYKPYTLHLIDFRHDKFVGTEQARNFSSDVRLVDPEKHVDRDVRIWMNHPLRHRGETFYQASFMQGDTGTVLQVVKNPGWLLPYISCGIVTLGMLWHFGVKLNTFIRRQKR
jgi:hypothetical protein